MMARVCTQCCMHGVPLTDICAECKYTSDDGKTYVRQIPEVQRACPHMPRDSNALGS